MTTRKMNATSEAYFVLLGFSNWPHLEVVLFVVVLVFYLMTLTGNLFIIILSYLDSHLHTPMYFSSQISLSWISAIPPASSLSCWSTSGVQEKPSLTLVA